MQQKHQVPIDDGSVNGFQSLNYSEVLVIHRHRPPPPPPPATFARIVMLCQCFTESLYDGSVNSSSHELALLMFYWKSIWRQCQQFQSWVGSANVLLKDYMTAVSTASVTSYSKRLFWDTDSGCHSIIFQTSRLLCIHHYFRPTVLAASVSPYDAEDTEQPACMCAHAHIHTHTHPSENNTEHICVTVTPYAESQTF